MCRLRRAIQSTNSLSWGGFLPTNETRRSAKTLFGPTTTSRRCRRVVRDRDENSKKRSRVSRTDAVRVRAFVASSTRAHRVRDRATRVFARRRDSPRNGATDEGDRRRRDLSKSVRRERNRSILRREPKIHEVDNGRFRDDESRRPCVVRHRRGNSLSASSVVLSPFARTYACPSLLIANVDRTPRHDSSCSGCIPLLVSPGIPGLIIDLQ